jgi:ABC-type transporter Mla maintaining outer membrane lipid asymmetry ATPase subunit MlaF
VSAETEQSQPAVLVMTDVAVSAIRSPERVVIHQVGWTVRSGEYWVIGGLPSSGKSDLLATAAGLMRPAAGSVHLFGNDLVRLHEEERLQTQLRVGMVFGAGGRLFNNLTVGENLALPLCYHQNCVAGGAQERVQAVLHAMDLQDLTHSTPVTLNRNLGQRVALARALVLSPELLFLDNPLAGIDPRETRWWLDFLDALLKGHPLLQGRPVTLVAGTDDLQPWTDHGRQFAFIDQGRFVHVGAASELMKQENPALRQLLPLDWLGE